MQQAATAMGARGFQNLQVAQGTDYTPTTGTDQSSASTPGGNEVGTATESVAGFRQHQQLQLGQHEQ